MRSTLYCIGAVSVVMSLVAASSSGDGAPAPAPTPAPVPAVAEVKPPAQAEAPKPQQAEPQPQKIEIIRLVGTADVQPAGKADWVPAKEKMVLPEGSTIFTGDGSTAEIEFSGDKVYSVILVQPLSEVRVSAASLADGAVKTRVAMRTGQVRVDLRPTAFRSDMQITTPNATASVTGSGCECACGGGATSLQNLYGSMSLNGQSCPAGQFSDVQGPPGTPASNPTTNLVEQAIQNLTPEGATDTEIANGAGLAIPPSDVGNQQSVFSDKGFFQTGQAARDTTLEAKKDTSIPGP